MRMSVPVGSFNEAYDYEGARQGSAGPFFHILYSVGAQFLQLLSPGRL